MNTLSDIAKQIYDELSSLPLGTLAAAAWGTFAAAFLLAFILSLASAKFNRANKKPFFALLNFFTAVTLAIFLLKCPLAASVGVAALFWCVGYLLYGALVLTEKRESPERTAEPRLVSAVPVIPPEDVVRPDVPAAKSNVRLEHAMNITDKLLMKNLGRGDRQELEKMRQTLSILQIKGALTPAEGEVLNDNFNALLKLMAKYNV